MMQTPSLTFLVSQPRRIWLELNNRPAEEVLYRAVTVAAIVLVLASLWVL